MPTLYSKKWTDKNGTVRYYKDEEARNDIITLKANSSTQGSVDYKISQALSSYVENDDYASTSAAGVVKVDGTTITIDNNGVISGASQVDTATNSSLGVVKGDGISTNVDNNGLLTALKVNGHTVESDVPSNAVFTDTTYSAATSNDLGLVKIDGTNMSISSGTIKALKVNDKTVETSVPANAVIPTSSTPLPVANGGTGASDASGARTNLGLGNAATASTTTSITSGGTGLPTSGAVYTAINNAIGAALAASY